MQRYSGSIDSNFLQPPLNPLANESAENSSSLALKSLSNKPAEEKEEEKSPVAHGETNLALFPMQRPAVDGNEEAKI